MIIVCPACQSRYKFDESKLGDRPKAKTRCAKCGATIEIENPLLAAMTLPPGTRPPVVPPPAPPAPGTDTAKRATVPGDEPVGGQTTVRDNPPYGRFYLVPYSDRIRNEAGVPTLVGGNLTTSDEIDTILAAGRADLCLLDPRLYDAAGGSSDQAPRS